MGVDLIGGHGDASFNWSAWGYCLNIAVAFGWQPAGTVAPPDYDGEWCGSYSYNDFQEVTDARSEPSKSILRRPIRKAISPIWCRLAPRSTRLRMRTSMGFASRYRVEMGWTSG